MLCVKFRFGGVSPRARWSPGALELRLLRTAASQAEAQIDPVKTENETLNFERVPTGNEKADHHRRSICQRLIDS